MSKSLDEALFRKENRFLKTLKKITVGTLRVLPWLFIGCVGIALIYYPISCTNRYSNEYQKIVESYNDTIRKTFPTVKTVHYTIVNSIKSDKEEYHVWVKAENGNTYSISFPKNKCAIHIINNDSAYCVVRLRKYKGYLMYYNAHTHELCDENNPQLRTSYYHRRTNEFGLRDDKPANVQYDYFDGHEVWYKFNAIKLIDYWNNQPFTSEPPKPPYSVRYFNSHTDIYVNKF